MNVAAFRHFYDYHFGMSRFIWNSYIVPLSEEQFTQPVDYSYGSVRDQIVHLIDTDDAWFSDLRGAAPHDSLVPGGVDDRETIRAQWDELEQTMRAYLAGLQDEMLLERPFAEGEDKDLYLWQILVHVVNHGTDHRAQLLRVLHDLGVDTTSQDYIFYAYERPFQPGAPL